MKVTIKNNNFIPIINLQGPIKSPITITKIEYEKLRGLGFTITVIDEPEDKSKISSFIKEDISNTNYKIESKPELESITDKNSKFENDNNNNDNNIDADEYATSLRSLVKKQLIEILIKNNISLHGKESKDDLIQLIIDNDIIVDEVL